MGLLCTQPPRPSSPALVGGEAEAGEAEAGRGAGGPWIIVASASPQGRARAKPATCRQERTRGRDAVTSPEAAGAASWPTPPVMLSYSLDPSLERSVTALGRHCSLPLGLQGRQGWLRVA